MTMTHLAAIYTKKLRVHEQNSKFRGILALFSLLRVLERFWDTLVFFLPIKKYSKHLYARSENDWVTHRSE